MFTPTITPSEVIRMAQTIWFITGWKTVRNSWGSTIRRNAMGALMPSERAARICVGGTARSPPRNVSAR